MNALQMLVETPLWAREHGLNDKSFDILENIVSHPNQMQEILADKDEGTVCCVKRALEYAQNKGIV